MATVAQDWGCDDCVHTYDLPFSFNFYGQDYTTIYISSNGYIAFGDPDNDYNFNIEEWSGPPIISALNGDLLTDVNEGDDMYIDDSTPNQVTIRWQAVDIDNHSTTLNFEIVLHSDNTFEINYGDMHGVLATIGSVGVSNGAGSYRLSAYNSRGNWDNVNTSAWDWVAPPDEDGASSIVEDAAPNDGDANNDGTPDSQQQTVTSIVSPVDHKYVTLEADSCTTNSDVSLAPETATPAHADEDYQYPAGLLSFTMTGCVVGGTETVAEYFYGDYDLANLHIRKYNSVNHTYSFISGAALSAVTIGGEKAIKAVYQIVDGGPLDADGTANGSIVDPTGIAVLGATTGAPNTGFARQSPFASVTLLATAAGLVVLSWRYAKRQRNN